jgi:vancomycin aglycone glucosyltransferase
LLVDKSPLPDQAEKFLSAGAPPIFFGFGSTRSDEQTARVLLEAARQLGRRSILSQGWSNISLNEADCLTVGEINYEKLLERVEVVVHHGGAGTTTAAALAGKAQVIVPHVYEQYYWAHRVESLGVGVRSTDSKKITVNSIVSSLRQCLRMEVSERANQLAARVERKGAKKAAEKLVRDHL